MNGDVYDRLADALDRLPNGFPRTASGVEIRVLQKMFTADEAALACQLTGIFETIAEIAERVGLSTRETAQQLKNLAERGMVWNVMQAGRAYFRLAPFIVGVYEAQVNVIDHELAHLIEDYFNEGGQGIMAFQPALHRVVPAQKSIKSEWILPYDDVRSILLSAKAFSVQDCICRRQQNLLGHPCEFPLTYCLSFSQNERAARPGDISQSEALAILDKAEEIGLVHTVANVVEGVFYICNCCGCCCGILRGITEFGIENSVAFANYFAVIDADLCVRCGICSGRCQVKAITEVGGVSVVDRKRCIGCGLCVTGCPNEAARLERKPDAETVHPPVDYGAWEEERLRHRGLVA